MAGRPVLEVAPNVFVMTSERYTTTSTMVRGGDRLFLVTNRCEVLCLDVHGLANGNDQVGRNLMDTVGSSVNAYFPQLEGRPRYNEDGAMGLHAYIPFWDYKRNRWPRDAGLRLDHLLLSPALAPRLKKAGVDREVRGEEGASDHAPAWIVLG